MAAFDERTLLLSVNGLFEYPVQLLGNMEVEEAPDLAIRLAFGSAPLEESGGASVVSLALDCDDVEGRVESPISASIEAMPGGESRGC